jgi:hypothetical protein
MNKLTVLIDNTINLLKWPVAVLAVLNLPKLLSEFLVVIRQSFSFDVLPFWLGMLGYILLWKLVFSRRNGGDFLPTLMHECIHALFAYATFHRVVDLNAQGDTGHVQYVGGPGNWLITIAPYFFPLSLLLAVMTGSFVELENTYRLPILGIIFGFECVCTWRELHPHQQDIHNVGFVFAYTFLPSALLISYGAVVALAVDGQNHMMQFLHSCWNQNVSLLTEYWQILSSTS